MKVIGILIACIAITLASFQTIPVARDVIKKEYKVNPGGTLSLDLDRGNIEIESNDENYVKIEMERRARAESSQEAERLLETLHQYEFDKDNDEVSIRSRIEDERGHRRWRKGSAVKIRLSVRVPSKYDVSFKTGGGNVTIMDVSGEISGRTGAGNVLLENIVGELDIKTGAGNIEVSGSLDDAEVATGAGNLSIFAQVGDLYAVAGTGNVTVEIEGQPKGESKLRTGAGNVSLSLHEDVQAEIRGTASIGTITCEFPIDISKKFLSHSFEGDINGGGSASIVMNSGVGNLSLLRR